ncbi:MAG: serine/threonine-protein kinase [Bryobacteraceae bacterium]|nr:serine/threonine-protein kinase [Bryobacteraceae bacterium]
MRFRVGSLAGRYRVEGLVGSGGMGEVYQVIDTSTGSRLAMKTLNVRRSDGPSWQRFLNEAGIQASLSHPGVTAFYEAFLCDETPCIVMEYVDGDTLHTRLQRRGPFASADTIRILQELCDALSYLHEKGILHRDLKSSNVKLTHDGRVKLLDFGIARARDAERLTQTGMVMGTPEHLPPEVLQGRPADETSEVWSLGVLAYELVTGRLPFDGGADNELFRAILSEPPQAPSRYAPGLPPQLEEVILRCLEKNPAKRYRDVPTLRRALNRIGNQGPRLPRRALVAAAALFALVFVFWLLRNGAEGGDGQHAVTLEVVNGEAEVWENGRMVGRTPYTRRTKLGERLEFELRRDGFAHQTVQFDVTDRQVYSYALEALPNRGK